jgi:hypothetical protein
MTTQLIPFFSDPSWFATMTFEGTSYVVQFDYNERCASWYMSIADANGVDIYNGVKLVTGFSLLAKCKDPRAPAGIFFVTSSTADQEPPGLDDLLPGGPCQLIYCTSDWVAILEEAGGEATLLAQVASNTTNTEVSTYGQPPNG